MATVVSPTDQRIVLDNISWEMYESLLEAHRDRSAPRFTYDQGRLEIMSPSPEHETLKDVAAQLVNIVAEELEADLQGLDSTTFRREDLDGGFEPDACFYIKNAVRIRGKTELDLRIDPPPDLLIEIDITSPSINKFPIFAQLGVPEVWRYDGQRWIILVVEGEGYVEREKSTALPGLSGVAIERLIEEGRSMRRPEWLRRVREWAEQLHS